ncbi:septal ring lytic transglycosylase RlpA family protein [Nonomuraea sp. PA05]|nr:septal ring lytic transglycosylase RlpA family protein [Nonomuraea sp. PA05]
MGNDSPARTTASTPKPSSSPVPEAPKAPAAAAARQPSSQPSPSTTKQPRSPQPSPATAAPSHRTSDSSPETSQPSPQASKEAAHQAESKVRTETAKTEATKAPKFRVLSAGSCGASYYGEPQMTASGERFNPSAMTAAHKTLPLGSKVRVTNSDNGESVTVRINDRGPYIGGRCLDLSKAAFAAIGNINSGVMRVKYEVLGRR